MRLPDSSRTSREVRKVPILLQKSFRVAQHLGVLQQYPVTTDRDHGQPTFPNLSTDLTPTGPNQLWAGFAYAAVILDGWSRRVVGYAISRSIDARMTLAALAAAIKGRKPPPGCVHHSDRGSQYAAAAYRDHLAVHGLVGSMGRRGNPYDNATAESFMKALKVEAVYPMAFETFIDVVENLPPFLEEIYNRRRLHSTVGYLSPVQFEDQHTRRTVNQQPDPVRRGAHSIRW
jgi:putative transposase